MSKVDKAPFIFLRERFGHMGSHSGYDQLFVELENQLTGRVVNIWRDQQSQLLRGSGRFLQWLTRRANASPYYDIRSVEPELKAIWKARQQAARLVHVSIIENNYGLLKAYRSYLPRTPIVATVHQPASWWRLLSRGSDIVNKLDALIVLSTADARYFNEWLPGKTHYIPHGVDTVFFCPSSENARNGRDNAPFRCLFSGQWLRDMPTLSAVIDMLVKKDQRMVFDIVYPQHRRNEQIDTLLRMARHRQVYWHTGISDEQLKMLYQRADVLLLPLIDCTANNALLEAMACGLPIVTSAVGGVFDYLGGTGNSLHEVGDGYGMAESILKLAEQREEERQELSIRNRRQAVEYFSWPAIASQTYQLYQTL